MHVLTVTVEITVQVEPRVINSRTWSLGLLGRNPFCLYLYCTLYWSGPHRSDGLLELELELELEFM